MLDLKQAERLVEQLQKAEDRAHQPVDPSLPLQLERVRRQTENTFRGFRDDNNLWFSLVDLSAPDLVTAGLKLVARWFC
jgi:hypothetical protein